MFVSAPDWDTLLDVFSAEPLPDVVVPDAEGLSTYGPYRSAPSSGAPQIDLEPAVRCPTCEREMDRIEFAAISRVIIDVCPEHGVWLDAGELERLIESMHPHSQPEPPLRQVDAVVASPPPLPAFRTMAEAAREPETLTPEQAAFVQSILPPRETYAHKEPPARGPCSSVARFAGW